MACLAFTEDASTELWCLSLDPYGPCGKESTVAHPCVLGHLLD